MDLAGIYNIRIRNELKSLLGWLLPYLVSYFNIRLTTTVVTVHDINKNILKNL